MSEEDRDVCYSCRFPFTDEEWDGRHSDAEGEDVHEECCDLCYDEDDCTSDEHCDHLSHYNGCPMQHKGAGW